MQRAVEHVQKLQDKLTAMQKEQHKGVAYDFVYEVEKEVGKADKVTKKAVIRKKKVEDEGPIV